MREVLLENRDDGVRVMTLDDPDRRNALGSELGAALGRRIGEVAADPHARALIVRGAGTAFCAGADLPELFGDVGVGVGALRERLRAYYRHFLGLRDLAIPTIAAVQGPAIGAGMNLALACDIRIAGPQARLGVTFSRIGLHPGGGATQFLVDAMGAQAALRAILEGRTFDAEQARSAGLVDEVVDEPFEAALRLAVVVAGLEPELARDIKRCVQIAASGDAAAALEFESWAQASSAMGASHPSGRRSVPQITGGTLRLGATVAP